MKVFTTLAFLIITIAVFAQKKILDHPDFEIWNTIEDESIAPNGSFVLFSPSAGRGRSNAENQRYQGDDRV